MEETGPFGTLVTMSDDWDNKEAWIRRPELFQTELMPALNRALCGQSPKQRCLEIDSGNPSSIDTFPETKSF